MGREHESEVLPGAVDEKRQKPRQPGTHKSDADNLNTKGGGLHYEEGWLCIRIRGRIGTQKLWEDRLKKVRTAHAALADSSTIDKELLLEDYKLHIDLYKHYWTSSGSNGRDACPTKTGNPAEGTYGSRRF